MDQLDIAIRNTSRALPGPDSLGKLAERMQMRPQVLRNKCCPTTETHKLTLREGERMILETRAAGYPCYEILDVLNAEVGRRYVGDHPANPVDLITAVLQASAESGDASRVIREAIADGVITCREHAAIRQQIGQAHEALNQLEQSVALATAVRPTPIRGAG